MYLKIVPVTNPQTIPPISKNGAMFKMVLPKKEYTADNAVEAMKRMSKTAEENNISDMSLEDINAEITDVRNSKLQ